MAHQETGTNQQFVDDTPSPDVEHLCFSRRRAKVHRSHSENIGRWRHDRQVAKSSSEAQAKGAPPISLTTKTARDLQGEGQSIEARDSGISLGTCSAVHPDTPAPTPLSYRDIFQPWERLVSQTTTGHSYKGLTPTDHVDSQRADITPSVEGHTFSKAHGGNSRCHTPVIVSHHVGPVSHSPQFTQARERLSGLLTIDRRGAGRYWWNGYKKSDNPPPSRPGLSRAHSFNTGPRELPQRTAQPQTAAGLPYHQSATLPICHMRVTSDPGALDPNLANHEFHGLGIGPRTASVGSGPKYIGSYSHLPPDTEPVCAGEMSPTESTGRSPTEAPTGGRYPSHTQKSALEADLSTEVSTEESNKPQSSNRLHHPLVRLQSRSTDELSHSLDDPPSERMTQSLTAHAPRPDNSTSWQPLGWLTEKGRKLSGLWDKGRTDPERSARREKSSKKPRSLSVERSMKLSRPITQEEYEQVMLRADDAKKDSKRWCYVYQDNEGIKLGALTKDVKKKEEKERDSKDEEEKSETALASEEYSLTKQVIIQRDERGYGLTVSGDNPVFVQSVKENGAAARAGVHKGDRILKVNGTLVTKCNHKEVVKLIKSGSYVALTLLGRPSGQSTATPTQALPQTALFQAPSPGVMASPECSPMATVMPSVGQPSGEKTAISGPTAVNPQMDKELKMQKISMIRFMYEKECEECEKLTEELRQNPHAHQAQQKLEEKLRLRGRLGDQLYQLTGIPAESHISGPKSPPSGLPPPGGTYSAPSGPHKSPIKRHGSGEIQLTEDTENGIYSDGVVTRDNSRLTSGPKHLKTKSMPESFYNADLPPSGKNVTVSRSNSDSRKHEKHSIEHQTDSGDGSLNTDDTTEKLNTSASSSDTAGADHSTNQHLLSSPTQTPEIWDEISESTMSQSYIESPNTTQGSMASVSPLREIRPNLHVMSPLQADVIPMEEEEEEVNMDDEHLEDHGPFSDLNRLKHKPAHLAVFLYYLISNSDPSPLLFYMVTEQYTQGSMKELRRWAYEIYSTFLVQSAAIKVEDISTALLESIENVLLHRSDKEDIMRTVFQNARHMAQKQISELLADFRQKRTLGLANLYGDNELSDNMDRAAELKTVESKLLPHLEKCTRDIEKASPRDKAMAWALATIMKQLGVTPAKNSTVLERCQSFISKDKKPFKLGKSSSKKNGHQFVPTHYHSTVYCNHCRNVLWGVGYQGFQCSNCDINVHKMCMEQMVEMCSGRRKKEKRSSMLNLIRKTTNPNPAAIKEAQRIHDESSGGHMVGHSASRDTLYRIQAGHEEEEDLEVLRTGGTKVSNLVDQFSQIQTNDGRPSNTPPRAHSPDLVETDEQKRTSSANLGRSESLNKKRENRRSVRRTRSDVQVDDQTLKSLNQSGSSSNSSLSNRSLDSPSTSAEVLTDNHHPPMLTVLQEDSDFEVEPDLPPLVDAIPKDQLKKLSKTEKKRQEVINELFYTERAHIRNLKVMDKLFRVPMMNAFNDQDMIDTLFTGIEDLIEVHSKLNNRFKNTRKEACVVGKVADLLLSSFDGEAGDNFKKCAATFCRGQAHALDYLRARQRKEPKLANFIQEASSNPLCHRRELKDLIPMATHRLTKYPLLINSLLKDTSKSSDDYPLLQKAAKCSRDILDYVNQAVKEHENRQKLADMQKRVDRRSLDNSNYQNFDLQQYKLVHDGLLTWRISKQKQIQLHVLLLDEHLVLLQKQDDRLILKHQSTSRDDNNKSTHSPIIELSKLMVRPVATDKHAMFLISDGEVGPQIYELVGPSVDSIKKWFKYLSESTSDNRQKAKTKGGSEGSSGLPPRPSSMVVPDTASISLQGEGDTSSASHSDHDDKTLRESSLYSKSKSLDNLEKIDPVEVHSVIDTVLAQPSEVIANTVQVNTAEVTNTPSDRLKEQEAIISSALAEKRSIVAEMLGVPVEDFQHISEMAAEVETGTEPRELVLGCLHHADQLTSLVSVCLDQRSKGGATEQHQSDEAVTVSVDVANNNSVGHTEGAGRTVGDHGNEAGPRTAQAGPIPTSHDSKDDVYVLASHHLIDITATLKTQLNQLTVALAVREREQERLHTELNEARTQVEHLRRSMNLSSASHDSRPASYISITSSASDMEADVAPPSEVSLNQVVLHESSVVCQTIAGPQESVSVDSTAAMVADSVSVPTEQVAQTSTLDPVPQTDQVPAKQTIEQCDIKPEDSENTTEQSTGHTEHSDKSAESAAVSDTEQGLAEDSDAFEDAEDITGTSGRDTSSSSAPVQDASSHEAIGQEGSSSLPTQQDAGPTEAEHSDGSNSDGEDI